MRHTGGIFKSYSPEAEYVEKIQETHRRNVQKLARKQKMLKRIMRHTGGIFKSYSPEAEYVEKIQEDTLAESSQAGPEAANVEKTQEDTILKTWWRHTSSWERNSAASLQRSVIWNLST